MKQLLLNSRKMKFSFTESVKKLKTTQITVVSADFCFFLKLFHILFGLC